MLVVVNRLKDLSFSDLMEVYLDANRERGLTLAPEEPEARRIALAEQDFYCYLRDCFFSRPEARYCIWEENKRYVSALRLEAYRDGLLLEALETVPNQRRRGYAGRLIQSVQRLLEQQGTVLLYSHVDKRNKPSLKTHFRCGFEAYLDCASYIDGSVNDRAYTLRYEKIIPQFEKKC